ncbi:MAG: DUF2157 domain-containing protein [Chloroflexi bacterium]|nr:DUF2157 domain-containing protein [Chloroflexota bacterium]
MPKRRFTERDLERWVERGLITSDQQDAILRDLETSQPDDTGLNLTTLLYYSGGLLVLVAYGIFLGLQWEQMNEAGRVAISAGSLAFFAAVSYLLSAQGERFRLPGELLQVVAITILPLLIFALLDLAGVWPDEPRFNDFRIVDSAAQAIYQSARADYQTDLTLARMALALPTLLLAGTVFRWSRSPFMLVAIVVAIASLAVDVTLLADTGRTSYELETGQTLVITAMGAALLAAGVLSRDRYERDYSLWLYVMGLAGLTLGLSIEAFPHHAAPGWGVLWLITSVIVLGLSIPLQERLFAAAGLLAIFAFLTRLVFEVFDSANAAFALIVLGVLVIAAGVIYQRLVEDVIPRTQSR